MGKCKRINTRLHQREVEKRYVVPKEHSADLSLDQAYQQQLDQGIHMLTQQPHLSLFLISTDRAKPPLAMRWVKPLRRMSHPHKNEQYTTPSVQN